MFQGNLKRKLWKVTVFFLLSVHQKSAGGKDFHTDCAILRYSQICINTGSLIWTTFRRWGGFSLCFLRKTWKLSHGYHQIPILSDKMGIWWYPWDNFHVFLVFAVMAHVFSAVWPFICQFAIYVFQFMALFKESEMRTYNIAIEYSCLFILWKIICKIAVLKWSLKITFFCSKAVQLTFWWIRVRIFLLYFSMNYRDFSVKSKLIISLFQTVKLSLSISLSQKIGFSWKSFI